MKKFKNRAEAELALRDVMSDRLVLVCQKHMYAGDFKRAKQPVDGCKDCATAMIHSLAALCKGDKTEFLEKLMESARKMVELEEKGQFDWKPFLRPEIKVHNA